MTQIENIDALAENPLRSLLIGAICRFRGVIVAARPAFVEQQHANAGLTGGHERIAVGIEGAMLFAVIFHVDKSPLDRTCVEQIGVNLADRKVPLTRVGGDHRGNLAG